MAWLTLTTFGLTLGALWLIAFMSVNVGVTSADVGDTSVSVGELKTGQR